MQTLADIVFVALMGFGSYQYNFGWWKRNRRFPADRPEPTLDAFIQGDGGTSGGGVEPTSIEPEETSTTPRL